MTMRRELYPAEWESISLRIRERAGWRCEWCGVKNGQIGVRELDGAFLPVYGVASVAEAKKIQRETRENLEGGRIIKIVLTVAHLGVDLPDGTPGDKHNKMDVRDDNLAALCQRCHLNYDRDEHAANATRTRRRKQAAAGQLSFLSEE